GLGGVSVREPGDVDQAEVPWVRAASVEDLLDKVESDPCGGARDGFFAALHEHVEAVARSDPRARHSRADAHPRDEMLNVDDDMLHEMGELDAVSRIFP